MTAQPQWSPTDDATADLLDLIADPTPIPGSVEAEWHLYVGCLRTAAAMGGGLIDPNALRAGIAGRVKAQRCGAFTHRALSQGLVAYTGRWVTSTDAKGRNQGRPCRELTWTGSAS